MGEERKMNEKEILEDLMYVERQNYHEYVQDLLRKLYEEKCFYITDEDSFEIDLEEKDGEIKVLYWDEAYGEDIENLEDKERIELNDELIVFVALPKIISAIGKIIWKEL